MSDGVRVVDRVFDIFEVLATHKNGASLSQIAATTGMAAQYHTDYAALVGSHEAGCRIARQVPCNALPRVIDVVQTHPRGVDQQGVDIFVVIDCHDVPTREIAFPYDADDLAFSDINCVEQEVLAKCSLEYPRVLEHHG